ncbi:hypothetical protein EC957_004144 [Mortierella hygrophila]|uniref:Uncharacterized protein n=1 Tax=Mortierella hygrophila TaxID=979708 RepID=A0A9P6FIZ0_9FUNG|nr:hypothetical protein EC957_004144 [Mortierella hygrophila]
MHHRDPVQGLKRRQPPNTKNERSLRQRTALLLAIVIVNSTPPGTSVLDRMGQIIQDREQQQEQQRCTDATKSQQATTFPQQDEDVEGVDKGGGGGAGRRNDFSPDRTRSPSPRLAEKRQQQQQQTQQLGFGGSIAGGRDQAWKLREKLLEMEIDTLRRWKLNRQLEEDRARLRNLEAADSCIYSTELVECKHRLLGHLDVIRRNQYFLEQAIASSEKQTIGREEVPTSLWNLSMTTNLILAVKEVTAMLCSPMIRFNLSERAYIHTMDAVQGEEIDFNT